MTDSKEQVTGRSIKALAPKPSDAIKAMVAGLRELPNTRYRVDMNTYGTVRDDPNTGRCTCYGCAATYTVHELAAQSPSASTMSKRLTRASLLDLQQDEMADFEDAIDLFRRGKPYRLFEFYDLSSVAPWGLRRMQEWYLMNSNWDDQLPLIEDYAKKLEAAGL